MHLTHLYRKLGSNSRSDLPRLLDTELGFGVLGLVLTMTLRTSGIRQPSIWASIVSDQALALRDWLLGLGFTEDLMIPGEEDGLIHHCQLDWPEGGRVLLSSTGERSTPCRPGPARCMSSLLILTL